jgi:hypothetical protein
MPRVNWGVSASDVDNFDRDNQFAPYDGPIPVNGVYAWRVKVLKSAAAVGNKLPQLRVGLQLIPRKSRKEEHKYKGYFLMAFLPISERTNFRYVPFLDAIGVTGKEFERGTITDEEGNVKKIGRWRNTGEVMIKAEIKDGVDADNNPRKDIGWMGAIGEEDPEPEEDDEDFDDDDADEMEYDDDEEEPF